MQCWFYRCQTFLCTNCRSIGKPKPSNLTLSLLSRGTVRHPRLTVYRRDLGAPNPGIGPHWSSRSGPPDPDYQISDLPGRRGPGAEMPNPDMRIGIPSLGLELHPPVSDDHRLWKHNYGQIWDRQQRRQADDNGVVGIGVSNIVIQVNISEQYGLGIDHHKLHVHAQKLSSNHHGRGGRREVRAQRYRHETQFANNYGGTG